MSISTITRKVEDLGSAWEQFKEINNRRLNEIEKKGTADAVTIDHLNKINNALDTYKSRVDTLEVVLNRPAIGGMEYKSNISHELAQDHKEAFVDYVRKGVDGDLTHLEKKALSSGSDVDGGYLLTPNMSGSIAKLVFETSPMRKIASVSTVSTDQLDVIQDNDSAAAAWATSETSSVSDSNSPAIGKLVITAHELVAQPKAAQRLIDDSSIDIENWLTEKLSDIFSRTENTAFISGNGSGKPKGILSYSAGNGSDQIEQINSGSSAAVTSDSLIKVFYALKDEYAQNANFLMNRSTVQAVRLLKESSTNQYLWQPGLASGQPDSLLGVPVIMASDMPVPTANSLSIAVGDFRRAYQIVDRTGIRILRDPYTEKPYVKFYTTKRVGGEVVLHEAIKILKLAA